MIKQLNQTINKVFSSEGFQILKKRTRFLKHLLIILSFAILAFLSYTLLMHAHFLSGGDYLQLNWQRIVELKSSIIHHHFLPQFMMTQMNGNGSAVMALHPYLNLYPFIFLSIFISSKITLIYTYFMIATFISLMISFYSSRSMTRDNWTSYLFALIYSLSISYMAYAFKFMDVDMVTVFVALPLIIFGFIRFIKNNHWLELSTGLILVTLSQNYMMVFIAIILLVWGGINWQSFVTKRQTLDLNKLTILGKAVGVTALVTSVYWIPALKLHLMNVIQPQDKQPLEGIDLVQAGINSVSNVLTNDLSLFALVGLIFIAIMFYTRFTFMMKQMYWMSIVLIFLSSNLFPWGIFQNTFVNLIQFPARLLIFSQLLLSYIFAVGVTQYVHKRQYKRWTYVACLVLVAFFQFYGQKDVVDDYASLSTINQPVTTNVTKPFRISSNKQLKNLKPRSNANELVPQQSLLMIGNVQNDKALYNVNQTLQFNAKGHGNFTFNNGTNQKIGELNLPFIDYSGENYFVYIDHHIVPSYANKTQLLTINNVRPGNHKLQVKMTPSKIAWFSRLLTIVGIMIYMYVLCLKSYQYIKIIKLVPDEKDFKRLSHYLKRRIKNKF